MKDRNEGLDWLLKGFLRHSATYWRDYGRVLLDHILAIQVAYPELSVSLHVGYQLMSPEGGFAHQVGLLGESGKGLRPFEKRELLGELPSSADPSLTDQIKDFDKQRAEALYAVAKSLCNVDEVDLDRFCAFIERDIVSDWWGDLLAPIPEAECEEEEKEDEAVTNA